MNSFLEYTSYLKIRMRNFAILLIAAAFSLTGRLYMGQKFTGYIIHSIWLTLRTYLMLTFLANASDFNKRETSLVLKECIDHVNNMKKKN